MKKSKLNYTQAKSLADKIKHELEIVCERVEIAGSIRRRREVVGDIEIVCIPRRQTDLFGAPVGASWLEAWWPEMVNDGRLILGEKNGEKYKEFYIGSIPDVKLDLFITTPDRWPVIFAIRTGCSDFSRLLVTQKSKGGYLPSHLVVRDGFVWDKLNKIPLETEEDFLELCGGWVYPWDRHTAGDLRAR